MTIRLSQRSLTGTPRTLVAVGTVSERSMFLTVRAGAPLSVVSVGSSLASEGADGWESRGVREDCLLAEASARGVTSLSGVVFLAGLFCGFPEPWADFW